MRAARVTVVDDPCVRSNLPLHTLESQKKRDTNGFIAIQEPFKILPILLKMLCSNVMA